MFIGTLRPFQEEALDMVMSKESLLIAMVMGAGKTPTSLAAIEALAAEGKVDGGLIIVPASLKFQWQREILKFTDEKPFVIDGTPEQRRFLYKYADRYRYTIVGYNALLDDWREVRKLRPDFIVLDEATQIKGPNAQRTQRVKQLALECPVRIALTGQPIENRPEELFSIMEFVDEDVLGDFEKFDRTFIVRDSSGRQKKAINLDTLNRRLKSIMFRRKRADIADQLPQIIEEEMWIQLDTKTATLYRYIANDLLEVLYEHTSKGGTNFNLEALYGKGRMDDRSAKLKGQVMSRLLCLRMLCCDPALLLESAQKYIDTDEGSGSSYAAELLEAGKLDKLPPSPKKNRVLDKINAVLDDDPSNKLVLFSFFKGNLRSLKTATADLSESVIFNGDMSARQKDKAHQEFSYNPDCRLFLSSDAGGYGVNLDKANWLLEFDEPWSAGARAQRRARIDRLSSEFEHINLVTALVAGSVEERQHGMLKQKQSINDAYVDGKYDRKLKHLELSLSSLTTFLEMSEI